MLLAVVVAGVLVVGIAVAGAACYRAFAVPNMKPLSAEQLVLCRRILATGRAYPFMCRAMIRRGECACQPCPLRRLALEPRSGA